MVVVEMPRSQKQYDSKSIEYNFVLIAPKFSSQNFSLGDGYNLGNVYE